MTFTEGAKDGKHYWLTPEELIADLRAEFRFDYDPCPYPRPEGYDGLTAEWGSSNYVNPPFGAVEYVDENGKTKKRGATAWARKCIEEFKKGKRVVMVYPIDKWVLMLLGAGAKVRNLGDVKWEAIEDRNAHKGTGRHIAMFILDPEIKKENTMDDLTNLVMQACGCSSCNKGKPCEKVLRVAGEIRNLPDPCEHEWWGLDGFPKLQKCIKCRKTRNRP